MRYFLISLLFGLAMIGTASAQMPVIDNANLTQAQQIASNTQQILDADKSIMNYTQKTLQAVTGDRSSDAQGQLSQMALGSGFSMGSAPSLSSVISGGALSFTGMGSGSQNIVSTLLSGLQLVSSITGMGTSHPNDRPTRTPSTSPRPSPASSIRRKAQSPTGRNRSKSARNPSAHRRISKHPSIKIARSKFRPAKPSTN